MTNKSQICPTAEEIEDAKIVLRVYAKALVAVRTIEKQILRAAIGSFYYKSGSSTLSQCNKIIDMIETKEEYLRLRTATDDALELLGEKDRDLLIMRFVNKLQFASVADRFGWSLRNCFRRYDGATRAFCKAMKTIGYFADPDKTVRTLPLYEIEKRKSDERRAAFFE